MSEKFEFRPASADEMAAVTRSVNYAFDEESEDAFGVEPEWTLCAFDGKTMAATSGAYPFKMQFNGQVVANAGVTIVTTEPQYRRRGLVRELMTQTLHRARDNGQPVATLWASMGAIYQRFGYGLASHFNSYKIDPRFAGLREPQDIPGTVKRMTQDEALPLVKKVYDAAQAGHTLVNDRSDSFWTAMFGEKDKKKRYFAVYFDEKGEPSGYASYRQKFVDREDAGPSLRLMIGDFIWQDMDAWRGLWKYLCSHDLAGEIRFHFVADDDPAQQLLSEPRMLNRKTSDGIWLRVVDVAELLRQRGYTQGGEALLTITGDEICPWNNGSWHVAATGDGSGGEASAAKDGARALRLNINTLASLISGFASASHLARIGKIECDDPAALLEADALFSTRIRPWCANEF